MQTTVLASKIIIKNIGDINFVVEYLYWLKNIYPTSSYHASVYDFRSGITI